MVTDHTYTQLSLTKINSFTLFRIPSVSFGKTAESTQTAIIKIKLGTVTPLLNVVLKLENFIIIVLVKKQVHSLYHRTEYRPEHIKKRSLCSGISWRTLENGTAKPAEYLYAKKGN